MSTLLLRKVRAVRRRLVWVAFCRRLLRLTAWLSLAHLPLVVAERLARLAVPYRWVFIGAAGAGALALIVWMALSWVRLFEAAVRADQALDLKERLSTALSIREPRSEAEAAVLEDAAAAARAIRPAQTFPLGIGRPFSHAFFSLGALLLIFFYLPQFDLLAKKREAKKNQTVAVEARKETARQLEDLAQQIAQTNDLRAPELAGEFERKLNEMAKDLKAEKMSNEEALAKMDKLGKKLEARQSELEKKLAMPANLQNKGEGKLTNEVAKALEKANFNQAAKALDELKQKLQRGELTEQEKAALQKELKSLAAKLGENPALAQALAKAGEELEAGKANQALAEMEKAGDELGDMQALLAELKELEGMKYDMEGRKSALSGKCGKCGEGDCEGECEGEGEGPEGHKPWKPGDSRNRGNGMGGPGIGRGSVAEKKEGQTGFEKKRLKGDLDAGRILSKVKIPGSQTPGEARVEYEALRLEYSQKAEDTIQNEQLPLEARSLVRNYFDAIKDQPKDHPAGAGEKSNDKQQ